MAVHQIDFMNFMTVQTFDVTDRRNAALLTPKDESHRSHLYKYESAGGFRHFDEPEKQNTMTAMSKIMPCASAISDPKLWKSSM